MITKTTTKMMLAAVFVLFVAVILGLPHDAFAGNNTLRDVNRNLGQQITQIPKLIALAAYVIGAFFAVRALFALKGFIEAPDDNPITKVLGFAAVSALLIMLPFIINVMTDSLQARNTQQVQAQSQQFQDTTW